MKKAMTYKELLSQSTQSIEAEQLESTVSMAQNEFDMGMLSLKGKIITATGELKKAEGKVASEEANITKVMRSQPGELVQNLINAWQNVEQAKLDVAVAKEKIDRLQAIQVFLENTKKTLFA